MQKITLRAADFTETAQFHIQIRQAVLAAQPSTSQVGLFMIDFGGNEHSSGNHDGSPHTSLSKEARDKACFLVASVLRDSDALCRITGTEIAVLLSSLRNSEAALLVAQKILGMLNQSFQVNSHTVTLRPHIGVALFPHHGSSAATLLECAYIALNSARQSNKSCVVYSPEFAGSSRAPLRLSELRQAIVQDELFLVYQPKIDLKSNRLTGVEALARWRHPELGLIMPDEFIPLAERTGLIIPLSLWVLNHALTECRSWREQGNEISVALNLSMWNLYTMELPEQVKGLLASTGVLPNQLELEITESAIMDDPQRATRTLKAIRDLGVRFAIDDFGTGYSSLAQLKKLPVSSIKIDKSFIQNMENDKDNAVIVRAIVELGHNLGLKVIAEGVETIEAKEMLTEFDCDEAQGYFFSRPVCAGDVSRMAQKKISTSVQPTDGIDGPWTTGKDENLPSTIKPSL